MKKLIVLLLLVSFMSQVSAVDQPSQAEKIAKKQERLNKKLSKASSEQEKAEINEELAFLANKLKSLQQ